MSFWDDSVSEYDLLVDAKETEDMVEQYNQPPEYVEVDDGTLEDIVEESSFELNKEESLVVYNTRIRLQQAKLYEMLINHNLFDGIKDIDERAIRIVSDELKHYIVKRLEVLMGLRQPVKIERQEASVFNPIEIDFLKQLSNKGTRGESAKYNADPSYKQENTREEEDTYVSKIKPLSNSAESRSLKPLVANPTKVAAKPKKNIKLTKSTINSGRSAARSKKIQIKSGINPRKLTPGEAEFLAAEELRNSGKISKKQFKDMTERERVNKIREVNERNRKKSSGANPLKPMGEQELIMKYSQERANRLAQAQQIKDPGEAAVQSAMNYLINQKYTK